MKKKGCALLAFGLAGTKNISMACALRARNLCVRNGNQEQRGPCLERL